MLEWMPVEGSSRIVAMAYDRDAEAIFVRFPGGAEWRYEACPPTTWEEFSSPATSKGKYIHEVLNHRPNGRHSL